MRGSIRLGLEKGGGRKELRESAAQSSSREG
jgi:hypothetical protein